MHKDFGCVIDSTMVRLWYHHPEAQRIIQDVLSAEQRIRLLSKQELQAEGCDFPDNRFGDDIFLADPGVLLVPSHLR